MSKPPTTPAPAIAAPNAAPRQTHLFARKAVVEYPPQIQSADSLGEAEADDRHRYYIKGDVNGRLVRASEWICTHLAEEIQLGAPAPAIIERIDGTLVFGSRRIAGVADAITTSTYLTTPTGANAGPAVAGLCGLLSSIYALDMFIHNEDRHLGNFLSIDDNGIRRLYAYDFSRALFWAWPWPGFPQPGQNTRFWGAALRQRHGFDQAAASTTLARIESITATTVESFINRMPTEWLPAQLRADFLDWWSSSEKNARATALRKGMNDGSLL